MSIIVWAIPISDQRDRPYFDAKFPTSFLSHIIFIGLIIISTFSWNCIHAANCSSKGHSESMLSKARARLECLQYLLCWAR